MLQRDLARAFGVTVKSIQRWSEMGMPRLENGRYELARCIEWRRQTDREQFEAANETTDIRAEKLRKARLEADLLEIELADKQGKLMTVQQFDEVVTEAYSAVKTQLLTLPARAAHDFVGLENQKAAREKLREYVLDVMKALETGFDDEDDEAA
jgi:phage terminase Nu1 subunit (DNA packaging protein)